MFRSIALGLTFAFALTAVAEDKKPATAESALKSKLKTHEDKLAQIRAAMLKECDEELKTIDESLKKAEKTQADAADATARGKAFQEVSKLRSERLAVAQLRSSIERRVQLDDSHRPVPAKTEEQRLGIATAPPSAALATQIGLKKDEGIVVERVDADAPAAKIGLKKYDVLVQIDGKPVPSNPVDFRKLLAGLKADSPVDAVVVRAGKQETVKGLTVPADKPAAPAPTPVKDPKESK